MSESSKQISTPFVTLLFGMYKNVKAIINKDIKLLNESDKEIEDSVFKLKESIGVEVMEIFDIFLQNKIKKIKEKNNDSEPGPGSKSTTT